MGVVDWLAPQCKRRHVLGEKRAPVVYFLTFCVLATACTAVAPLARIACKSDADCPSSQFCNESVCEPGRRKPETESDSSDHAALSSANTTAGSDADPQAVPPRMAAMPIGAAGSAASSPPTPGARAGASAEAASPSHSSAGAGATAGPANGGGALGSACRSASECASDHCVDYVCCDSASCSECQRCGNKGLCENVEAGDADAVCGAKNMTCNAKGRCAFSMGAKCTADDECATSHCAVSESAANASLCCDQDCGVCSNCKWNGSGCNPITHRASAGRCDGTKTCVDGACMLVDKDVLDYDGPVETSVTGHAWVAQTWTANTSGQLVEIRVLGNCAGAVWPTTNRISIHGQVSETGAPDNGRVLTRGEKLVIESRSVPNDDLVVYPIDGDVRVSAGDKIAAVFALGDCRLATTDRGATGLWTANDTGFYWRSEGALSLRFMSVIRP